MLSSAIEEEEPKAEDEAVAVSPVKSIQLSESQDSAPHLPSPEQEATPPLPAPPLPAPPEEKHSGAQDVQKTKAENTVTESTLTKSIVTESIVTESTVTESTVTESTVTEIVPLSQANSPEHKVIMQIPVETPVDVEENQPPPPPPPVFPLKAEEDTPKLTPPPSPHFGRAKYWGEPRTIELVRTTGQSLGISIVGGKVELPKSAAGKKFNFCFNLRII